MSIANAAKISRVHATPDAQPARVASGWEARFHLSMLAVMLVVMAVSLLGYLCCGLKIDGRAVPMLLVLGLLAALAGQYWLRGEQKLFNVLMMVLWIVLVTNCHFFPMYMAARTPVPMNDALLAQCDRMLGIEVPTVRALLADYPWLDRALLEIYKTLIPLMTLAVVVTSWCGRMDLAKRFIVGCILAAAMSLPIFACLQAVGPWKHYGFAPPFESLSSLPGMFAALKTSEVFVVDVTNRDGLITFPSFHVVLTVLAAAALWPLRRLRWPVTIWAALIVVSTVTTGIHYTVDVLGGLAIAAVAHRGALVYSRWEQGRSFAQKAFDNESSISG